MTTEVRKMKKLKDGQRGALKLAFVALVLIVLAWASLLSALDVGYEYESEVGAHFRNAGKAQTPEIFIEELDLALDGMERLELEEGMSARWFSWEQTPDHDVGWLIDWVESTKARAEAVIDWREHIFENDLINELTTDLYNSKVRHLRESLNGAPTWIAGDAYYHNYHPVFYWVWAWGSILLFSTVLLSVVAFGWVIEEFIL